MARNTSVTLGAHFEAFITSKIEQGRFHSVSEAVRTGLRKLEEDEARLEVLRCEYPLSYWKTGNRLANR